jgi:hypothetical protein
LLSLVDEGLIDSVVRQLMSGKEATVYVVRCGDDIRCAKVYKDMAQRISSPARTTYTDASLPLFSGRRTASITPSSIKGCRPLGVFIASWSLVDMRALSPTWRSGARAGPPT